MRRGRHQPAVGPQSILMEMQHSLQLHSKRQPHVMTWEAQTYLRHEATHDHARWAAVNLQSDAAAVCCLLCRCI